MRDEFRRGAQTEAATKKPWYTAKQGRYLTGLALLTVISLANMVNIWSEDWSMRWLSGAVAFFGVALVSVASVPVFLTWVFLSLVHGQPRIRRTLELLSRCSGIGTAVGFVVAIAAGFRPMGGWPGDSSSIVTLLLQGLGIGAVIGFTFGLFIVVIDTAKRLKNRYVASAAAVAILSATSALSTQIADPRHVWTRFLAQLTAGVPPADTDRLQRELDRLQTAEAKRAFTESVDWRAVLADKGGEMYNTFPSPWQFTVAMTITITVVTAFSLIHWLRTRSTAPQCPAPDLSVALGS